MTPIGPNLPSYLQWGFACVRSRAFRLGPQAFGCVPFIDFANHTDTPNADIRVQTAAADAAGQQQQQQEDGSEGSEGSGSNAGEGFVELVALADVAAGSEITMSYSGPGGFTNQVCRLLGFCGEWLQAGFASFGFCGSSRVGFVGCLLLAPPACCFCVI